MPLDVEKALHDYRAAGELITQYGKQIDGCKKVRRIISDKLRRYLHETKQEKFTTTSGFTIYTETRITPSGADWDAFFQWVKEHDAFDALEQRIKSSFIKEYMEKHNGGIPPGVSVYREKVARVRKKSKQEQVDGE